MEVMPGINLMWIEVPDIIATAQPGQFVTVRCEGLPLRRPFSIHQADESKIALLFRVVGKGTLWLSQRQRGDKIDLLGPLGRGFSIKQSSRNLLLIAGGIGVAPLVFLAWRSFPQHSVTLIHGASTATQLYPLPLPQGIRFIPVTEDGSIGKGGKATDVLAEFLDRADQIYACGPIDMYKAMVGMLAMSKERSNLKRCQISLEVRMGCGIGACYACTINTKKGLKQVCRDGPIFELDDIMWEEVRI